MAIQCSFQVSGRRLTEKCLHSYERGACLYLQGDPATHWFEVVSGIVRTCRFHSDGNRQLTGFYYTGDVFGLEEERRGESAEAIVGSLVRVHARTLTSESDVSAASDAAPASALRRALDTARKSVFLLGHKTADARVAAFLLEMRTRSVRGRDLDLPMSRSDIGDHLGLTVHTVSRTISGLARHGMIALNGPRSIRLLDEHGLAELAGEAMAEPRLLSRCG